MSNEYKIVFRGDIIPPTNLPTAKRRLSLLLDVPPQAVNHIFDGQTYILKEHLHESQAQTVKDSLAKMGLNVECVKMVTQPAMASMAKVVETTNASKNCLTDDMVNDSLFSFASYLAQPSVQAVKNCAKQLTPLDAKETVMIAPLETTLLRSSASVISSSSHSEKKQILKVIIQTKKISP